MAQATPAPHLSTLDVGGPVHIAEWGGDGPALLLVHGLGGSSLDWLAVAPELARTHQVVALDLVGFGRSPRGRRSSSVGANAEVVVQVARSLRLDPVTLVGNSMGGLISLLVAWRHPELVEGLVLVDPAVPAPLRARPDPLVLAGMAVSSLPGLGGRVVSRRGERLGPAGVVTQTLRICCVDPSRVAPEQREAFIELARERRRTQPDGPEAYSQAARSLIAAILGPLGRASVRGARAPTLVVHGREDRLVDLRASQRLAAGHPERTLVVLDDCGHIPMIEVPDRFLAAVLPWLAEHRRPAA